ncbi:DUF2269 family protein [Noviherbaspirillum aridicola]|uniref:Membrane protein n=1 Tax=Noviherbaspirillum aridicola TaxID=2849687 RepID=A0ABQ4Q0V3_9BURK|nr:DUF2269 domain-containing protein [Noviherbaspirillum aridicola]GIZ50666.1 membrane protein [Noviherbaspirillum aridicola]
MSTYLLLKTLHVLSSVILAGTGFGSFFYLLCANRSRSVPAQAVVVRYVVLADWMFTTPAGFIQPITGFMMMAMAGWSWTAPWIFWSLVLYVLAGACWLPVLWLQLQMRKMAEKAMKSETALPEVYWRYARRWELLGWPAFGSMVAIYFLMVGKPMFGQ